MFVVWCNTSEWGEVESHHTSRQGKKAKRGQDKTCSLAAFIHTTSTGLCEGAALFFVLNNVFTVKQWEWISLGLSALLCKNRLLFSFTLKHTWPSPLPQLFTYWPIEEWQILIVCSKHGYLIGPNYLTWKKMKNHIFNLKRQNCNCLAQLWSICFASNSCPYPFFVQIWPQNLDTIWNERKDLSAWPGAHH